MRALAELEKVGYAVRLDGEKIRLSYQGEGKPDPSTVKPLMDDLKERKPEAIRVLRDREALRIFRGAIREISYQWVPGLLEHTRKHHPDTSRMIDQAERAVEDVWARTLQGSLTLDDFREAVMGWRDTYHLTLEEHRKRACGEWRAGEEEGVPKCAGLITGLGRRTRSLRSSRSWSPIIR